MSIGSLFMILFFFMCNSGISHASEHSLVEENGFGYYSIGDYCVIEYYDGIETDVKIPEEFGGKQKIYVDIFRIKGKNDQVRSIHLSKNVCGIYGDPDNDEDSYSDKVHSSMQMKSYSDKLKWREICVNEENPFFTSKDGVLYSRDMKTLYVLPALLKGRFVVPDSVTKILNFPENSRISEFVIGNNVKYFKDYGVLSLHKYLNKISVKSKNKFFVVKNRVLYNKKMTRILGSVKKQGIYRIPSTVVSMENFAFASSGLTQIKLSDRLIVIPVGAFANCKKLNKITFGKKTRIIAQMSFYKTQIKTITLPKTIRTVSLYQQSFRKIITENKMLKVNDDVLYGGELDDDESVITSKAAKRFAKENKIKIVICP